MCKPHSRRSRYRRLMSYLHEIPFVYILEMDGNRAEDGVDLRYRFGYECGYIDPMISACLDGRPCSVLEMMVALAFRCEEHIMDNAVYGDRTGEWFFKMIQSLGLESMDDASFDKNYISSVISRFLDRNYQEDGTGGLFAVKGFRGNMKDYDIWYQMCWYLDEIA